MNEIEIWKQIKDFPNYEISNMGNIRSKKNGLLKLQNTYSGYKSILLYKMSEYRKKTIKSFFIHRLVLSTFKPVDNMENLQVNHIDLDRTNNKLSNLEWATAKENCAYRNKHKENYYNSQICYDSKGNKFNSYREAGRYWNLSPNTVKRDVLGLTNNTSNNRVTFHK